ncbi:MAG: hypothetical protein SOX89_01855 [Treponema sp.]|nr:hypothetical protein [Treponema sp.]
MKKIIFSLITVSVLFLASCNNDSSPEQKIVEHVTVQSVKIPESVQSRIANNEIKNAQKEDQTVITDYLDSMQTQESLSQNLLSAIKTAPLPSESRDTSYTDLKNYSEELQAQITKMTEDLQYGSASMSFVKTPGKITDIPNADGLELTIPLISMNVTASINQTTYNTSLAGDIKNGAIISIDCEKFPTEQEEIKSIKISEEISNSIAINMKPNMTADSNEPAFDISGKATYITKYNLGEVFVIPLKNGLPIAGKIFAMVNLKLKVDDMAKLTKDFQDLSGDAISSVANPSLEVYKLLKEYFEIAEIQISVYDLYGTKLFDYKNIKSFEEILQDGFSETILKKLKDLQNQFTGL